MSLHFVFFYRQTIKAFSFPKHSIYILGVWKKTIQKLLLDSVLKGMLVVLNINVKVHWWTQGMRYFVSVKKFSDARVQIHVIWHPLFSDNKHLVPVFGQYEPYILFTKSHTCFELMKSNVVSTSSGTEMLVFELPTAKFTNRRRWQFRKG